MGSRDKAIWLGYQSQGTVSLGELLIGGLFPLLVVKLSGDGMDTSTELWAALQIMPRSMRRAISTLFFFPHPRPNSVTLATMALLVALAGPQTAAVPPSSTLSPPCVAEVKGGKNPQGSWPGLLHEEAEDTQDFTAPWSMQISIPSHFSAPGLTRLTRTGGANHGTNQSEERGSASVHVTQKASHRSSESSRESAVTGQSDR